MIANHTLGEVTLIKKRLLETNRPTQMRRAIYFVYSFTESNVSRRWQQSQPAPAGRSGGDFALRYELIIGGAACTKRILVAN